MKAIENRFCGKIAEKYFFLSGHGYWVSVAFLFILPYLRKIEYSYCYLKSTAPYNLFEKSAHIAIVLHASNDFKNIRLGGAN